jgi:hypothetical protein
MSPRLLLHLEGAAVLALSVFFYRSHGGNWAQFALLFLVPDISMLGYLANARVGALTYNAVHTYVGPVITGWVSVSMGQAEMLPICLIWSAHIGFDRLLGYGLKHPTAFKDTHLNPARHAPSFR